MKTRKMLFLLLISIGMVLSLTMGAQAAQGWFGDYFVTTTGPMVVSGGATVNRIAVTMTKPGSPTLNCWFAVGREKEMLSIAMTALANSKSVDALVDTALVNNRYTILNLVVK